MAYTRLLAQKTRFGNDVRSNVQWYSTTFICIVQISSLATACIG